MAPLMALLGNQQGQEASAVGTGTWPGAGGVGPGGVPWGQPMYTLGAGGSGKTPFQMPAKAGPAASAPAAGTSPTTTGQAGTETAGEAVSGPEVGNLAGANLGGSPDISTGVAEIVGGDFSGNDLGMGNQSQ